MELVKSWIFPQIVKSQILYLFCFYNDSLLVLIFNLYFNLYFGLFFLIQDRLKCSWTKASLNLSVNLSIRFTL